MKKPFESYNGGKEGDGVYQKIINRIPVHDLYIEAFLGNGAIFRHKKLSQYSIGIDIDTGVISKWNEIIVPGINLINTDAISWLENFTVLANILKKQGTRVFIFIDPPYLMETRKSSKNIYSHELTIQDHNRILSVARSIDANIMISHYPCELYNNALHDWNSFNFTCQTRKGPAVVKIYFNYAEPDELHDYRYLGDNFRERERIKGIVHRNVSKFKRMPDVEKNALVENLVKEGVIKQSQLISPKIK